MGGDIAAWCALRGCDVTLQDRRPTASRPAVKRAAELFRQAPARKPRRSATRSTVWSPTSTATASASADVIIEAIFENLPRPSRSSSPKLEAAAKPGAILATNTSSLKLADIAPA